MQATKILNVQFCNCNNWQRVVLLFSIQPQQIIEVYPKYAKVKIPESIFTKAYKKLSLGEKFNIIKISK